MLVSVALGRKVEQVKEMNWKHSHEQRDEKSTFDRQYD